MDTFLPAALSDELPEERPQGPKGNIRFAVKHAQTGKSGYVDEQAIAGDLHQMGYKPVGFSPDGMKIKIADDDGDYEVAVPDIISKMGYESHGAQPRNADLSMMSPALRNGVTQSWLGNNDQVKQQYLEHSLLKQGIEKPQVYGSGRNWYYFQPETGKHFALTNAPGMHVADLGEVAGQAPRYIGGAIGGTASVLEAPETLGASLLTSGAQTALGGALGDSISNELTQAFDPEYREQVYNQGPAEVAKNMAANAGEDFIGGFGARGLGHLGKMMGFKPGGAISKVATKTGQVTEPVGNLASKVGKIAANSPNARDFVGSFSNLPGTGAMPWMAEAAGDAPAAAAKGIDWFNAAKTSIPPGAKNFASTSKQAIMEQLQKLAESGKLSEEASARLYNMAGKLSHDVYAPAADIALEHAAKGAPLAEETIRGMFGRMPQMNPEPFAKVPMPEPTLGPATGAVHVPGMEAPQQAQRVAAHFGGTSPGAQKMAGQVGEMAQDAAHVGKLAQAPFRAAWQTGARGLQGAGQALKYGGKAASAVGRAASPYETNVETRLGAEEIWARIRQRQRALQAQGFDPKLVPEESQLVDFDPSTMPADVTGSY